MVRPRFSQAFFAAPKDPLATVRLPTLFRLPSNPEAGLGIFPGAGGTVLLPRLVGAAFAKELIFSARRVPGTEAASMGLVNNSVPLPELAATAELLA